MTKANAESGISIHMWHETHKRFKRLAKYRKVPMVQVMNDASKVAYGAVKGRE